MVGSFAAALGPACFLFLRPILVVGCGGGSYLGLSFYNVVSSVHREPVRGSDLLVFIIFAALARRTSAEIGLLVPLEDMSTKREKQENASLPSRNPRLGLSMCQDVRTNIEDARDEVYVMDVNGEAERRDSRKLTIALVAWPQG